MHARPALRALIASAAAMAVALSMGVTSATAATKPKPKLETPKQLQKVMLTAAKVKAITGYPGALVLDPTQSACSPFGNTFTCESFWLQETDSPAHPFRLEVVPFSEPKFARNDLARTTLQLASKGATVLSASPNKVALYFDNVPESGLTDTVLLGRVVGRFEIYVSCGLSADSNDPGSMLQCGQLVSDAQAKALSAYS